MALCPRLLLSLVFVAAGLASIALAEEARSSQASGAALEDQAARVNELEGELAAMRQQFQGRLAVPGGGSDLGCCEPDCCAPCCCLPGCEMGWYGAAELVWAQPSLHRSDLEYDYQATPRAWVGYNGCELGGRGHWWKFDDDANPLTAVTVVDLGGDILQTMTNTQESLELELADLEVTKMFSAYSTIVVAGGGRYVRYQRDGQSQSVALLNGDLVSATLNEFHERLQGFGPTLAAEVVTPVVCAWSLSAGFRATIAFREEDLSFSTQELLTPAALATTVVSNSDRIQIIEMELALQYAVGAWFVRGGWQAQHWDEPSIFSVQGFATAVGANY